MTKKEAGPKGSGLDYTFAKLRMPTKMKALLTVNAQENGNTLNAEILERLQSSLGSERLEKIEQRLASLEKDSHAPVDLGPQIRHEIENMIGPTGL